MSLQQTGAAPTAGMTGTEASSSQWLAWLYETFGAHRAAMGTFGINFAAVQVAFNTGQHVTIFGYNVGHQGCHGEDVVLSLLGELRAERPYNALQIKEMYSDRAFCPICRSAFLRHLRQHWRMDYIERHSVGQCGHNTAEPVGPNLWRAFYGRQTGETPPFDRTDGQINHPGW